MDGFDWEWALANVARDQKEHVEEVGTILNALKPWMNLPLYQQEMKAKRTNKETLVSRSFIDDLRKRGISEDVLRAMSKNNAPAAPPSSTIGDDDVDPPPRTING